MDTSTVPDYAEFDDYVYTQRIAVLVRWFLIVTWLVLHNNRPDPDEGSFYINNGPCPGACRAQRVRSLAHREGPSHNQEIRSGPHDVPHSSVEERLVALKREIGMA